MTLTPWVYPLQFAVADYINGVSFNLLHVNRQSRAFNGVAVKAHAFLCIYIFYLYDSKQSQSD